MNLFIVLIGDIVGSKELDNSEREQFQSILSKEVKRINEESISIVSPVTITLGDEFQAVYNRMDSLLADSWSILASMHPVRVRFSVGIGEIYTPINKEQALGMDGPAFHSARDGMSHLKENNGLYRVGIGADSDQTEEIKPLVSLVNNSLQFLSNEMANWKKTRYQVLTMMQKDVAIKKISEQVGISESAVYKNREEGHLNLILELKESIGENINRIL